jgi:hypothetical protein
MHFCPNLATGNEGVRSIKVTFGGGAIQCHKWVKSCDILGLSNARENPRFC